MKRLVVLGGGTAGTMVANKLARRLDEADWRITVVDQERLHVYQPGLLLLPFGRYRPADLVKPRAQFLPDRVEFLLGAVDRIRPLERRVTLADGRDVGYDYLVVATGTTPRPDQTPGLLSVEWRRSIFDFYSIDGATALRDRLSTWQGGRLVVHVAEMPIKCPVAPLEFAFLADAYFAERGMRRQVEITYVTPLDGAFTQPVAAGRLGGMLADRRIGLETDFVVDRVDPDVKVLVSMDERKVPFDLLVTVPVNMGADYLARSGLGDELNYLPVDKHTLLAKGYDNIFALGDATDIPTSKAGSVAHFSVELFVDNFLDHVSGRPMRHPFDGHANCFIESGSGKGLLLDFNYDTEPLPGKYPLPGVGPFTLLAESHVNHWGKLASRWAYWHLLLPGRPFPLPPLMSLAGKKTAGERTKAGAYAGHISER
jgi:sulfide:quinone oxidoreductase